LLLDSIRRRRTLLDTGFSLNWIELARRDDQRRAILEGLAKVRHLEVAAID
jgi:hypothetical protein